MGYPGNDLTFVQYQERSKATAVYPRLTEGSYIYTALGLCGEAGEIAEKLKKILRDKGGVIDGLDRNAIAKELGDVLWYLSQLATELDIELEKVARKNLQKVYERQQRGTLQGNGDDR